MGGTRDFDTLVDALGQDETPEMGRERRRYFRVRDDVVLKYRPVAPDELDALIDGLKDRHGSRHSLARDFANTSAQLQPVLRRVKEDQPDIALCLTVLNEKLDVIARHLSMQASDLTGEPVRQVDLSASGMRFEAEEPFPPGTLLEIRMALYPSFAYIQVVGEVVRSDERKPKGPGMAHLVAVDFRYLDNEDLELLVQHAIKKESRLLRRRRGNES